MSMLISKISNYTNINFSGSVNKNGGLAPDVSKTQEVIKKPDYTNIILKPETIQKQEVSRERQSYLKPVESQEEYGGLINELFNPADSSDDGSACFYDLYEYKSADRDLLGLVPYCGSDDISDDINMWLSGRNNLYPVTDDNSMIKIIRLLDYSLKKLDEKFGRYEGIVYRKGFFNPVTDKQFYSSSSVPEYPICHEERIFPSETMPYSIIKVKNGHNVYEFQKYADNRFASIVGELEKEILIDRKSKFRIIPENKYSEEDKKLKQNLISQIILYSGNNIPKEEQENLSKNIHLWEEI